MTSVTAPFIAINTARQMEGLPDEARPAAAEALSNAMDKCEVPPAKGWLAGLDIPAELMGYVVPRLDEKCMQAEFDAHVKPLMTPAGEPPVNGKAR